MHETRSFNNPFSGATLERRPEARIAADWLEIARADPLCRFVIGRGALLLVHTGQVAGIAYQSSSHPWVGNADPSHCSLLGWYAGACHVLVDTGDDDLSPPAGTAFAELRPLLGVVDQDEARLLLCARALSLWRIRHRFCGLCGSVTAPRNAGHSIRCQNADCNGDFFPRLDPAVIMLVHDGDHVLLGRQASWPPGRYSTLAGFVEVGESLEDAVMREVFEETGIRVEAAHYFASQPWPFPSSLMLGYHAPARRGPVTLDGELEDARWFTSSELERREALLLPPPYTIARQLIGHWFRSVTGRELNEQS